MRTTGGMPIAPGMEGKVRPLDTPAGPAEDDEPETKVIQIWRCTFCGYQAEVPKGTDMDTFVCPCASRSVLASSSSCARRSFPSDETVSLSNCLITGWLLQISDKRARRCLPHYLDVR